MRIWVGPESKHVSKNIRNLPGFFLSKYALNVYKLGPLLYAGGWQDETWPDGWTAVTRDGKRSAQFEHTLLVTETGCEILTRQLNENVVLTSCHRCNMLG